MDDNDFVKLNARFRMHVHNWDTVPVILQRAIANFFLAEKARHRVRILQSLNRIPPPPDDNPIAGGSPI